MISDVPYDQYNLNVEHCKQIIEEQKNNKTGYLTEYRKNNNIYLNSNKETIQDINNVNYYLYLILDTLVNMKLDYYLTNLSIEYNDRDFGSHAKLSGFANTFIKKLSKKLEKSLFKIKDRAVRIAVLDYLTNIFINNLEEIYDLSSLYLKFHNNKEDYNYKILMSNKRGVTKKIKICYRQYFPIIANLLQNCISIEKLLESFEVSNPRFHNIWKLFIDGENQNKGRLVYENEQGYLLNSLRGLAFALNEINQHKYIDYDFLIKISEVIGCNKREDISASIYLSFRHSPLIIKELFKRSYYKGSRKAILAMKNLLNTNLDEISSYRNTLEPSDDPNRIYLLEIFDSSFYPYIFVYYVGATPKKQYVNELLEEYYQAIENMPILSIEKVLSLSLSLCRELQYLHPLSDGTGRTFLFILLPLLLQQQGFWINSTIEHVWDLLSAPTKHLVNKALPICSAAPEINSKIDWQINMSLIDEIYIYCIMGDLSKIKDIIQNNYDILEVNIPIVNISPLEVAVLNNNVELIKFLLVHTNKKNLIKKVDKILTYLKNVNPELKKLISRYYLTMLDKPIKEKESFLFE